MQTSRLVKVEQHRVDGLSVTYLVSGTWRLRALVFVYRLVGIVVIVANRAIGWLEGA